MLLRRALYRSQARKAVEGTVLSFDCIHNLRVGSAHVCRLYGENTAQLSSAPVTPPHRQVGQGHTPLFTWTQELSHIAPTWWQLPSRGKAEWLPVCRTSLKL